MAVRATAVVATEARTNPGRSLKTVPALTANPAPPDA